MKNIASIKQNITRLNKYCDATGTSLFECLCLKKLTISDFCYLIDLDEYLLNSISLSELENILKDTSTRIVYSRGMMSLDEDEIEIHSPNLRTSICFLNKKIKIIWDELVSKDGFDYYKSEFMGTRIVDDGLETIHFSSDLTMDQAKAKEKIISLKYPLEHASIKIKYQKESKNKELLSEKTFQITINHDLLYSDLQNIYRILYNFNFPLAVSILKLYPASYKIMSDEVEMNNFHNR